MTDDILRFLKEFPDKWILFILCLLVGIMHYYFQNDFTSQMLNSVVSALIGLLIGTSRNAVHNNITTDTVNTPKIDNQEMNNASINISSDTIKSDESNTSLSDSNLGSDETSESDSNSDTKVN